MCGKFTAMFSWAEIVEFSTLLESGGGEGAGGSNDEIVTHRVNGVLPVIVWDAEAKRRRGVPMRIELGPKDLEKGQVCVKMRVDTPSATGKQFIPEAEFIATAKQRLLDFQDALLAQARARMQAGTVTLDHPGATSKTNTSRTKWICVKSSAMDGPPSIAVVSRPSRWRARSRLGIMVSFKQVLRELRSRL